RAESDQRDRAEKALGREAAEHAVAEAEKTKAQDEREIAEATLDLFLNQVIAQADPLEQAETLLGPGGPATGGWADLTLRAALDRTAIHLTPERLEARFPGRPLVQARVLKIVGDTYDGVGEYDQAITYLSRARDLQAGRLAPDDPQFLATLNNLSI